MFGGFGGPPEGGAGGFPGMTANVNMTTTTTTSSSSTGGMGGPCAGGDPGKKGMEMQERFKRREDKLPRYEALVDVLEIKGEDVTVMRQCAIDAKMTAEEMHRAKETFDKVAAAAMSFDFAKMMR